MRLLSVDIVNVFTGTNLCARFTKLCILTGRVSKMSFLEERVITNALKVVPKSNKWEPVVKFTPCIIVTIFTDDVTLKLYKLYVFLLSKRAAVLIRGHREKVKCNLRQKMP